MSRSRSPSFSDDYADEGAQDTVVGAAAAAASASDDDEYREEHFEADAAEEKIPAHSPAAKGAAPKSKSTVAAAAAKGQRGSAIAAGNASGKNVTLKLHVKPGDFMAKGLPVENVKGTRYPTNIFTAARIRPFSGSDAALLNKHQQRQQRAAATGTKPASADMFPPTALPFRAGKNRIPAQGKFPAVDQTILRVGLPEQGIFQNYPLDGVIWGPSATPAAATPLASIAEPNLPYNYDATSVSSTSVATTSKAASASAANEQEATFNTVGKKLADSIVYPLGGAIPRKFSDSPSKLTEAASAFANPIYGNACCVSYGASNSGKSYALFGNIAPPCPAPAPNPPTTNLAASVLANSAADNKAKEDAFYFANKNRSKRETDEKKKEGTMALAPPKNEDLMLKAKDVIPEADLPIIAPTDGLIVRTADALLTQLVASGAADALHMACLRLHNERLTDLCDLSDPHEQRQITTQLYYPETGEKQTTESSLHYYGLRGVKPIKVGSIEAVKELLVRARQQIQRAPVGYLATDVVPSLKGVPDEKDVAVKAKMMAKAKESKNVSKEDAAADEAIAKGGAATVHGSTMLILLYVVPKKNDDKAEQAGAAKTTTTAAPPSLPPRTALQKLIFVDLPDSNAVSKGVSATSINAGKELAFTNGVSAETPLQIANDKAINNMLLALGSSLADSVRYGRGKFPQHNYLFAPTASSDSAAAGRHQEVTHEILEDLLGATMATNANLNGSSTMLGASTALGLTNTNTAAAAAKFSTLGPTHYRNSLLTRVLKETSYGPNTFTAVLGCLSPLAADVNASANTLRFLQNVKAQPVTTVGWEELEALRSTELAGKSNEDASLEFVKAAVIGSLESEACEAFDIAIERRASEKAKVNPFMLVKLGATISSGASASLAPPNKLKEGNDFFKSESIARTEISTAFQTELTNLQKIDLSERLAIAKRANQSKKLQQAIASGNAAIGTAALGRVLKASDAETAAAIGATSFEDDFESNFRAPHKVTTSVICQERKPIHKHTASFIREHEEKYKFKQESKGAATVSTNTIAFSNQTYANQVADQEMKRKIAAGEMAPKHKKTGPPHIPNKKKPPTKEELEAAAKAESERLAAEAAERKAKMVTPRRVPIPPKANGGAAPSNASPNKPKSNKAAGDSASRSPSPTSDDEKDSSNAKGPVASKAKKSVAASPPKAPPASKANPRKAVGSTVNKEKAPAAAAVAPKGTSPSKAPAVAKGKTLPVATSPAKKNNDQPSKPSSADEAKAGSGVFVTAVPTPPQRTPSPEDADEKKSAASERSNKSSPSASPSGSRRSSAAAASQKDDAEDKGPTGQEPTPEEQGHEKEESKEEGAVDDHAASNDDTHKEQEAIPEEY